MTAILPEISAAGLVLWRLLRAPDRQAWCYVTEFCGEITLSVHELASDDVFMAEVHSDMQALVGRAEQIQQELLAAGWQLSDSND